MKILFVNRAKPKIGMGRNFKIQRDSLKKKGIEIDQFLIEEGGWKGYLKSWYQLIKIIRKNDIDIVHAHYIYAGIMSSLAFPKITIVSLLGSDIESSRINQILAKFFSKSFWSSTIVKSQSMKEKIGLNIVNIIPNGVDLSRFKPLDKKECKDFLGFDDSYHLLFFSNPPDRAVKNLKLAKQSVSCINNQKVKLHVLSEVPNEKVPYFMNASDVLLLTSYSEGSPNVIKEAMACNLPIVATDVGDISERLTGVSNCYLANFDKVDIAKKIETLLIRNERSNGREALIKDGIDIDSIASKIISIYKKEFDALKR